MTKKHITLYNLIFPIWLLWVIPTTWIVVLPVNFLIDITVVMLTLKYLKVTQIWKKTRAVIVKTWIYGFIADFIGTALMLLSNLIDIDTNTRFGRWWYENIVNAVAFDPFSSPYSILWVAVCILITAFFIYMFNYRLCFKKLDIEDAQKKKLSLSLAVFTAPYLFYLPTSWFF